MPEKTIHLVKLCVGVESVQDLMEHRARQIALNPEVESRHVTRMWPKQSQAILNGGSLYWVIKGFVQARQKIIRLDEVIGADGIRRCGIVFDPEIIRTAAAPKRPFQGWRYLKPEDAPIDLPKGREQETPLPQNLEHELANLGVI